MWRVVTLLWVLAVVLACRTPEKSVPHVLDVDYKRAADGAYAFRVTLSHDDTGWDHYADLWVIESLDGNELARRVLRHPHVEEQPFTRGIDGVRLPPGTEAVTVRARCSRHGYGPPFTVSLTPATP